MLKMFSPCLTIKVVAAAVLGLIYASSQAIAAPSCCSAETKTADVPSLQKELDDRANKFAATAPESMKETFKKGIEHVAHSGAVESAKHTGDQAPDFTLPDAKGEEVSLSNLLKEGPVVLVWYRGGWCPYCNMQLHAMQGILPQLKEAGAQLVAISPETPDNSLSTTEKNDLQFHVLSDNGNAVAHQYGIVYSLDDDTYNILESRLHLSEYNDSESKELPLTVAYVIKQDGTIAWDFVDADYKKRAEPADILKAVQALDGEEAAPAS
ncbi:peroxiredoxin-like family protein [Cerasicoccus frondis]|uniref:peroxiredoxin-like family protein n=1 Tax=Cerasicoccus frondis TaxID=490090 RepID=UPI002852B0BB|nr:peroxiredoxin-like family protein [Cerasicoccus frondis]